MFIPRIMEIGQPLLLPINIGVLVALISNKLEYKGGVNVSLRLGLGSRTELRQGSGCAYLCLMLVLFQMEIEQICFIELANSD